MLTETITILLVEGNSRDARLVGEMLREVETPQFQLIHVSRLVEALSCLTTKTAIAIGNGDKVQRDAIASISVVLLDLSLPEAEGLETVTQLHLASPDTPILVLGRWCNEVSTLQVLQAGAQDYLVKDHTDSQLLVCSILRAIKRHRAQLSFDSKSNGKPRPQVANTAARTPEITDARFHLLHAWDGLQQHKRLEVAQLRQLSDRLTVASRPVPTAYQEQRLLEGVAEAMEQLLITTDYQTALTRSLTALGRAADVDRVYLFENHCHEKTNESLTSQRFEWTRDKGIVQDNPALQNLSYEVFFRCWHKPLATGQLVKGLVRDFSPAERRLLESENIRSILVIPVMTEGKFWGFISFADCHTDRQWTSLEASLLTRISRCIGGTLVRQHTEEALRESEIKFRTLYESTSAAVLLLDENGIFDGNGAALQMFGCTHREQLCGKPSKRARALGQECQGEAESDLAPSWSDFLPPVQPNGQDSLSLANEYVATAISEGSCRFDWIFRQRSGEVFPAEVTLTPIELGNRKVLQAVIYDMAERKATETQLMQAKEAAEAGSRAKSQFLATMSHELRTPLNAVLGLSELMRGEIFGPLNDKQKEYITCIQSSGEHLLSLINDILDLSKVEAGKEQLSFVPLEIRDLCESCLTLVREQAHNRGLQLTLHIDSEVRIFIADERRCKQMLINLLSNAVKFTLVGEVSLIVTKKPEGIAFTVADTGIGIPADKLPLLFEPFRQLDSGLNRQFPGTGLGLALTRSLARLHGGDVSVESILGQGSQFTLHLPDWPSEEFLLPTSSQELGKNQGLSCPLLGRGRILLVENDDRSAMLLKDYLQVIGHTVEHLTDCADFLDSVRTFKPKLILMDVHLAGNCSGFDLLAALRQEPDTKNLTVVMVTAMAMAGDRERCLAAGADDYLSKPIGIAQLEAILMRYL